MDQDATQVREMVASLALTMARKAVSAVRGSELHAGVIDEKVPVGDTEWHINATYSAEQELVVITGHPVQPTHPLAAIFGGMVVQGLMGEDQQAAFTFALPAAWLPEEPEA